MFIYLYVHFFNLNIRGMFIDRWMDKEDVVYIEWNITQP